MGTTLDPRGAHTTACRQNAGIIVICITGHDSNDIRRRKTAQSSEFISNFYTEAAQAAG